MDEMALLENRRKKKELFRTCLQILGPCVVCLKRAWDMNSDSRGSKNRFGHD